LGVLAETERLQPVCDLLHRGPTTMSRKRHSRPPTSPS
jgi:hypothetical protein